MRLKRKDVSQVCTFLQMYHCMGWDVDSQSALGGLVRELKDSSRYGHYGYRRITLLLTQAGWQVGCDRVQRIWRREGLKVPRKQKPRGRLWLNDGSCIRLSTAIMSGATIL
ncbi:hypothetical protein GGQ85_004392 [Nitrobacter vulgaris]|nr:hypothetical protein [Nitrobacter vulgaris]